MRVFVLLSLVSVALAATKCDAKRTADKAVSRNNARVAKSTRGGSRRKGSSRDKGQGSSGGTSVAERTLLSELVQTNSERTGLNASNPAQVRLAFLKQRCGAPAAGDALLWTFLPSHCAPLTIQVASLTDKANFINVRPTVRLAPLTRAVLQGQDDHQRPASQGASSASTFISDSVQEGSCNGIVMGQIPAVDKMVSCVASRVVSLTMQGEVPVPEEHSDRPQGLPGAWFRLRSLPDDFQDFKVLLKINNLETGHFTNPNTNYYAAPQQLNKDGIPIGHTRASAPCRTRLTGRHRHQPNQVVRRHRPRRPGQVRLRPSLH